MPQELLHSRHLFSIYLLVGPTSKVTPEQKLLQCSQLMLVGVKWVLRYRPRAECKDPGCPLALLCQPTISQEQATLLCMRIIMIYSNLNNVLWKYKATWKSKWKVLNIKEGSFKLSHMLWPQLLVMFGWYFRPMPDMSNMSNVQCRICPMSMLVRQCSASRVKTCGKNFDSTAAQAQAQASGKD